MNHPSTTNLLRRTFLGLATAFVALWALPAAALTVTLQNATGNNCTYSGMNVDPAGNVTVTCDSGTVTPGSPGVFSVSVSTTSATTGQVVNGSITRASGTTGAVNVNWSASGTGCASNSGTAAFADGDGAAKAFSLTMGSSAGSCTVAITPSSGTVGTGSRSITVSTATTPPPPPPSGCPTVDTKWVSTSIPFQGKNIFSMSSGNIAYASLPTLTTSKSGVVHNSESTNSPDPVTVELAISKCPGQVDSSLGSACYVKSGVRNLTDIYWMIGASSGITSATVANAIGICWTEPSQGPYYVNIRWTYQQGSCTGGGICGFNVQWNNSGF